MIIKFKGSGPTRSNRGNGNDESHLPFNSIKPDFFPTGFSEAPKNNHPFLKNRLHFEPNILRGAPLNHFGHERAPLVFVFRLGLEGVNGGRGSRKETQVGPSDIEWIMLERLLLRYLIASDTQKSSSL